MVVDLDEINKPSWKPKFQSEFSMGEYDFARYNKTLMEVDELSGYMNSTDKPNLKLMQDFFAQLNNLYDDFRPLISNGKVMGELDELIKQAIRHKRIWESSQITGIEPSKVQVLKFVDVLNAIKRKLYMIKQVIGLGITVKRNLTARERINAGMGRGNKWDNLPEP